MISILIRNKNEANSLVNALLSIKKQKFDLPYEIVIIDNISTGFQATINTLKSLDNSPNNIILYQPYRSPVPGIFYSTT